MRADTSTSPVAPTIPPMASPHVLETSYRGYRFRSRLEARWAVCFDALGIAWEYEREGYRLPYGECYLPDFWLPQVSMHVEVKPAGSLERLDVAREAIERAAKLCILTNFPVLILDGTPRHTNYWGIWPVRGWDGFDADGLPWQWVDVDLFDGHHYHLSEGRFFASTGAADLEHHEMLEDEIHPAVTAARCARFEHGERG